MNTKLIMTLSAACMGAMGIALTFLPKELAQWLHLPVQLSISIVLQILGALYFSFAMINWTAKGNLIGGIYARPIAIGNLTHFVIGMLALVKAWFSSGMLWLIPLCIFYMCFAILFSIIFFRHPVQNK